MLIDNELSLFNFYILTRDTLQSRLQILNLILLLTLFNDFHVFILSESMFKKDYYN
jgi:hypothetical protein